MTGYWDVPYFLSLISVLLRLDLVERYGKGPLIQSTSLLVGAFANTKGSTPAVHSEFGEVVPTLVSNCDI